MRPNIYKVVWQHMQGAVGSIIATQQQIFHRIFQWKNFENLLTFDRIMAMSSVCSFLAHSAHVQSWCIQSRQRRKGNTQRTFSEVWIVVPGIYEWPDQQRHSSQYSVPIQLRSYERQNESAGSGRYDSPGDDRHRKVGSLTNAVPRIPHMKIVSMVFFSRHGDAVNGATGRDGFHALTHTNTQQC